MKRTAFADRPTFTHRDVRAGCFTCHGDLAHWWGPQAQGTAARHHDATGHETWCDIVMSVRYGQAAPDDRQHDLEAAIAASSLGGEPDAAPLPDSDAPAVPAAGVSANQAAQSKRALAAANGPHQSNTLVGAPQPEPTHA